MNKGLLILITAVIALVSVLVILIISVRMGISEGAGPVSTPNQTISPGVNATQNVTYYNYSVYTGSYSVINNDARNDVLSNVFSPSSAAVLAGYPQLDITRVQSIESVDNVTFTLTLAGNVNNQSVYMIGIVLLQTNRTGYYSDAEIMLSTGFTMFAGETYNSTINNNVITVTLPLSKINDLRVNYGLRYNATYGLSAMSLDVDSRTIGDYVAPAWP